MKGLTKAWVKEQVRHIPDHYKQLDNYMATSDTILVLATGMVVGDTVKMMGFNVMAGTKGITKGKEVVVKQSEDIKGNFTIAINLELPRIYIHKGKRSKYDTLEYAYHRFIDEALTSYLGKSGESKKGKNNDKIYMGVYNYSSVRASFYRVVKETDKTVWLSPLGKYNIGKDPQNGVVLPDLNTPIEKDKIIRRRKDSHGGIKISEYVYGQLWDGESFQEYSD